MRGRALVGLLVVAMGVGTAGPSAGADGPTGSLAGTVTDATGEPLQGVCVEVYAEEYAVTETGADGGYRFDDLAEGGHLVVFNACPEPLAGHATEVFDNAEDFSEATPVNVTAGTTRDGVDAQLEEAAVISGTITDEDSGDGLERACVVAIEVERFLFAVALAGADGTYALANLRSGEYLLAFGDCSDPFNHISEVYADNPLPLPIDLGQGSEPTTVAVEQGEEVDGIDVSLEEGGSVVGTVTTRHTGRPAEFVCVTALADGTGDDEPAALTVTGLRPDGEPAPGQFFLSGVRPGDYAVGFNPEQVCGDDGYEPQWATGKPSRDEADTVTVTEGEAVESVDAVIAPSPSISSICFSESSGDSRFSDVSSDSVHAPAIECLADNGIVSGRADGSYGPAQPVRRDQMATFVVGALRTLEVDLPADPPDAFRDDDASVHEAAIDQLAALGIVGGKAGGGYAPTEPVSRGQMATFLVRAYEHATGFPLLAPDNAYSDDDGTSHEPSIDRATTAGLAAGTGAGTFSPGVDVRRDQMATFVARLLDRVVRDTGRGGFLFFSTVTSEETLDSGGPAFGGAPVGGPAVGSLQRLLVDAAEAARR